ncbi:cytochrome P450 [Nannocystaceae bacterium ST9]
MSETSRLRELSSLPGPRGLPVLGNMLALDPDRFHLVLEGWAREFGDYYVFRIMTKPFLVVVDSEAIQKLLRERPRGFRRGARVREVIDEIGARGVFTAEGEDWTRQRKLVMAAFKSTQVQTFHDTVAAITERLLRLWRVAAREGRSIDVVAELMRYTVDVTTTVAFGQDMNTLEQGAGELQQHLARFFAAVNRRLRAPIPYWRYFKLPEDRVFERSRVVIEKVVFDIIREARAALERDEARARQPRNLLEAMLAAHDADDPGARLTDEEIYGNVLTLLLAGEDTTALTMAWMLYFIGTHPEVAARMRAEVDALLGEGVDLPASSDDLHALEYVAAVAQETLRLKGAAPLMFFEPVEDAAIDDVSLPAGNVVVVLTRAAANRDRHFSDPHAFKPERWLKQIGARTDQHDARAAMAFGTGPRVCPGRALALLECSMVAAMVVRHFDVEVVDTGAKIDERFDFTMRPDNLRIRLVARG